ncbi:MAG: phytanoyl-CoA dioxygenase family protein [Rhodospirillaceae bacterium]|jgi:ectoine hydroxylase|nr:phytanoyl-CoA dioxygenase family protein [Rhodospirillaceae bacterium]MBT6511927.1 phytanoyl-CoA dioxygenase family protein [Rhodospirillaceae bacterium]MBT7648847.1 phytanoyl-CoA dioxygenase family protein [Rhodospirillaceae bacterium]
MATEHPLTPDQIVAYHRDGYVVVPGMMDADELAPALQEIAEDPSIRGRLATIHDGSEKTQHDYLGWVRHGDDWLGTATRLARVVEGAATLIGEPVYHFHSKIVQKPAGRSGRVVWHQDYGGWYQDGCLMPHMLTCLIALTPATQTSGCLHMLKGSHKMGRVDRIRDGDAYSNINPVRESGMLERFEDVAVELQPGDGVFFHGNVVHSSGDNSADYNRILMEMSYNGVSNAPVFDNQEHHAVKPMAIAADNSLRNGDFEGVFASTPLCDLNDPQDEGYTIFVRDSFPDLS